MWSRGAALLAASWVRWTWVALYPYTATGGVQASKPDDGGRLTTYPAGAGALTISSPDIINRSLSGSALAASYSLIHQRAGIQSA